jgi:diguanylate cyclase (GGDEF)-like protein/PAS domain S-box-containing protein
MNPSTPNHPSDQTQSPSLSFGGDSVDAQTLALWQTNLATSILTIRESFVLSELLQRAVDEVYELLHPDAVFVSRGDRPPSSQIMAEASGSRQWLRLQRWLHTAILEPAGSRQTPEPEVFLLNDYRTFNVLPCCLAEGYQHSENLAVSLVVDRRFWGLLVVQNYSSYRQWKSFELEGLRLLACHVSQGIQQALEFEKQVATKNPKQSKLSAGQDLDHYQQSSCESHDAWERQQWRLEKAQRQQERIQKTIEEQSAILRSFYNSCPLLMGVEELVDNEINMISYNHASLSVLFEEISPILGHSRQTGVADIRPSSEIFQLWLNRYRQAQAEQRPIQFEYQYQVDDKTYWFLAIVSFLGFSPQQYPRFSYVVEDISDRKQHELELNQLKEQLELVIEAASEGFWEIDYRSNRFYYSPHWKEMLGYQDHELTNTENTWRDLIISEELDEVSQFLDDYKTGKINQFVKVIRFLHKDGSIRHMYCRAIAIKDSSDQVVRIVGSNLDITSLKETEIALQDSERNYRTIVENSEEGIWVIDHEGQTTFVNPRLLEMLGYSEDEILNQSFLNFIDPEDQDIAKTHLQQNNQGRSDIQLSKFRRKDGSILWARVSATTHYDSTGHPSGVISLLTDMTQMIEYQEALETSQMQLRGVLDSSLDGMMAFRSVRDEQGRIIDFEWLLSNQAACDMVQRSKEELIGRRLLVEMPGNRDEGLFDDYVQVVESGAPSTRQFRYNHENIDHWFENIAVKLGDGFVVTFRDVTAAKTSEQQLQRLNRELEERLKDLERRNQEMKILNEVSDFLQACLTVEEACLAISSFVEPLFPNCSGAIFMANNSRNQVNRVAIWGSQLQSTDQFTPQDCWALRRGTVHHVDQSLQGLKCHHVYGNLQEFSTLCVPMIAQGETLGLLYLNSNNKAEISLIEQQLARTVAEQVSMAIANLQLRETLQQQSIRDPLTGLFNRRYLDEFFDQEIQRASRNDHGIGVIMLDIDHFKQFNDTYGHDAGDFVLQQVGQLLSRSVRGSDIACRYGGEEMTLLLPESSLAITARRAEEVCQRIRDLKLNYKGQLLPNVTLSLGVACFPEHGVTRASLLRAADEALYRAKKGGRDQVSVSESWGI